MSETQKKIKESLKSRKQKKTPKVERVTKDSYTLELARQGKHTLKQIQSLCAKKWPATDRGTLDSTTRRRLHGHLQRTCGVTISRDADGVYSVDTPKKSRNRKSKTAKKTQTAKV